MDARDQLLRLSAYEKAAESTVTVSVPDEGANMTEGGIEPEALRAAAEAVCGSKSHNRGPRPLRADAIPPCPYPIDSLGDVLGPAARAVAAKVQCADAMAAQSVLSVASLSAQALADVLLPYGQTRPLSLFCLTIAASGDRKSSADLEAVVPVRMRERQLRDEYEPLAKQHAVEHAAWRAEKANVFLTPPVWKRLSNIPPGAEHLRQVRLVMFAAVQTVKTLSEREAAP